MKNGRLKGGGEGGEDGGRGVERGEKGEINTE